jgi:hypothetical protein
MPPLATDLRRRARNISSAMLMLAAGNLGLKLVWLHRMPWWLALAPLWGPLAAVGLLTTLVLGAQVVLVGLTARRKP